MIDPERFGVLDAVLEEGLGFALNPKGFAFFMKELRQLKEHIRFNGSIAQLEMGLFVLVRQTVRAR